MTWRLIQKKYFSGCPRTPQITPQMRYVFHVFVRSICTSGSEADVLPGLRAIHTSFQIARPRRHGARAVVRRGSVCRRTSLLGVSCLTDRGLHDEALREHGPVVQRWSPCRPQRCGHRRNRLRRLVFEARSRIGLSGVPARQRLQAGPVSGRDGLDDRESVRWLPTQMRRLRAVDVVGRVVSPTGSACRAVPAGRRCRARRRFDHVPHVRA